MPPTHTRMGEGYPPIVIMGMGSEVSTILSPLGMVPPSPVKMKMSITDMQRQESVKKLKITCDKWNWLGSR